MTYLTSFYFYDPELGTSNQIGIFQAASEEQAKIGHLKFFCRDNKGAAFVQENGLLVTELTPENVEEIVSQECQDILAEAFIDYIIENFDKGLDLAFESYQKNQNEYTYTGETSEPASTERDN